MCHASQLQSRVRRLAAWNMTPAESATVARKYGHRYGTTYIFRDGSVAQIDKGSARVRVKAQAGGVSNV